MDGVFTRLQKKHAPRDGRNVDKEVTCEGQFISPGRVGRRVAHVYLTAAAVSSKLYLYLDAWAVGRHGCWIMMGLCRPFASSHLASFSCRLWENKPRSPARARFLRAGDEKVLLTEKTGYQVKSSRVWAPNRSCLCWMFCKQRLVAVKQTGASCGEEEDGSNKSETWFWWDLFKFWWRPDTLCSDCCWITAEQLKNWWITAKWQLKQLKNSGMTAEHLLNITWMLTEY